MPRKGEEKGARRDTKDPIEQLLKSKDLLDRLKAIDILEERRDVERLLNLLYSESWHVREKAAKVLSNFGKNIRRRIEPLLDEGYWYVRASAAFILGEIGDEGVFPKLLSLLKERNETVKGEAAKALAKLIKNNRRLLDSLELDDKITLENTLKSLKEFELMEIIKKHESVDRKTQKKDSLSPEH